MAADKYDLLGPALSGIGRAVMEIVVGPPDAVYLYVEAGDGWVGPSLFRDEGAQLRYFDPGDSDLWRLLLDARCLEPAGKRWSGMEYMIDGGKFDAKFQSNDVDKGTAEMGSDFRRQRFLRARYGDKPIAWPPPRRSTLDLPPS